MNRASFIPKKGSFWVYWLVVYRSQISTFRADWMGEVVQKAFKKWLYYRVCLKRR